MKFWYNPCILLSPYYNEYFLLLACNCHLPGTQIGLGICQPITGICYCKENTLGSQCELCKDGFWGLNVSRDDGCASCQCSAYGTIGASSVCEKGDGQCPCKTGFSGRTCSKCQDGYYGYPANKPVECRECDCHPYGAFNMICSSSGQCSCRETFFGTKCGQITPGFYMASVEQSIWSASLASVSSPVSVLIIIIIIGL